METERLTSVHKKLLKVIQDINGGDVLQSNSARKQISSARVGPREGQEGLWEGEQKIIAAIVRDQQCRNVLLEITLLAAGFIVGSKGVSVTKIWKKTGASIRSYTKKTDTDGFERTVRVFNIHGTHFQIYETINIIVKAVRQYKELVEGKYADEVVETAQEIDGITFQYCPPPIEANPLSARTKQFPGKPSEYGQQRRERKRLQEDQDSLDSPKSSNTSRDQSASTYNNDSPKLSAQYPPVSIETLPPYYNPYPQYQPYPPFVPTPTPMVFDCEHGSHVPYPQYCTSQYVQFTYPSIPSTYFTYTAESTLRASPAQTIGYPLIANFVVPPEHLSSYNNVNVAQNYYQNDRQSIGNLSLQDCEDAHDLHNRIHYEENGDARES